MENNIKWHHGVPNKEQYEMAMSELDNALTAI
jgi:transketolase